MAYLILSWLSSAWAHIYHVILRAIPQVQIYFPPLTKEMRSPTVCSTVRYSVVCLHYVLVS